MKRYLISALGYKGDGELWFDETGRLIRIDVSRTDMDGDTIEEFKDKAPVHVDKIKAAYEGIRVTITEADIIISFEQWWKKYNHKINKARCLPLWNKMSHTGQLKAFTGIDKYNAYLQKESWRKKLDPENYLKNKTWENEYRN